MGLLGQVNGSPSFGSEFVEFVNYGHVRDIAWHPNGKIASLTRGNDEPYAQGLNARQLVDSIASYGETLNYFYNANARVTDIVAQFDDAYDRVFGYDGAGRLDEAHGPWGTGSYAYGPLGNITQKKLGSRTVDIEYDALNRIDRVRDTAAGGSWCNYAFDARGNVSSDGRQLVD